MDSAPMYEIRVQARLDDRWAECFSGVAITYEDGPNGGTTILTGTIVDQAALRGLLERIWDLNLTLISLKLIEPARQDMTKQRPVWSL